MKMLFLSLLIFNGKNNILYPIVQGYTKLNPKVSKSYKLNPIKDKLNISSFKWSDTVFEVSYDLRV